MPSEDSNFNPFQSMPQPAKPVVAPDATWPGLPVPRTARLGFFDCFLEAKDFLGTDYWLFWGLIFVGLLIGGAVPLALVGPMYCGIGLCFIAKEQGQQPSFDLLFKGFDYFVNSLIPVLLYSVGMLIIVPLYAGGALGGMLLISSGDSIMIMVGILLFFLTLSVSILGSLFISYGSIFACFLVADYQLEGMDAFNVSLLGMQKNLGGLLLVTIATSLLGICCLLLCFFPLILILPLSMCAPFICYRKIFRPQATM